jgi:hypothetical protein
MFGDFQHGGVGERSAPYSLSTGHCTYQRPRIKSPNLHRNDCTKSYETDSTVPMSPEYVGGEFRGFLELMEC